MLIKLYIFEKHLHIIFKLSSIYINRYIVDTNIIFLRFLKLKVKFIV